MATNPFVIPGYGTYRPSDQYASLNLTGERYGELLGAGTLAQEGSDIIWGPGGGYTGVVASQALPGGLMPFNMLPEGTNPFSGWLNPAADLIGSGEWTPTYEQWQLYSQGAPEEFTQQFVSRPEEFPWAQPPAPAPALTTAVGTAPPPAATAPPVTAQHPSIPEQLPTTTPGQLTQDDQESSAQDDLLRMLIAGQQPTPEQISQVFGGDFKEFFKFADQASAAGAPQPGQQGYVGPVEEGGTGVVPGDTATATALDDLRTTMAAQGATAEQIRTATQELEGRLAALEAQGLMMTPAEVDLAIGAAVSTAMEAAPWTGAIDTAVRDLTAELTQQGATAEQIRTATDALGGRLTALEMQGLMTPEQVDTAISDAISTAMAGTPWTADIDTAVRDLTAELTQQGATAEEIATATDALAGRLTALETEGRMTPDEVSAAISEAVGSAGYVTPGQMTEAMNEQTGMIQSGYMDYVDRSLGPLGEALAGLGATDVEIQDSIAGLRTQIGDLVGRGLMDEGQVTEVVNAAIGLLQSGYMSYTMSVPEITNAINNAIALVQGGYEAYTMSEQEITDAINAGIGLVQNGYQAAIDPLQARIAELEANQTPKLDQETAEELLLMAGGGTEGEEPALSAPDFGGDRYTYNRPENAALERIPGMNMELLDFLSSGEMPATYDPLREYYELQQDKEMDMLNQGLSTRLVGNSTLADEARRQLGVGQRAEMADLTTGLRRSYLNEQLPALSQIYTQGMGERSQDLSEWFGFLDRQLQMGTIQSAEDARALGLLLNAMGIATQGVNVPSYTSPAPGTTAGEEAGALSVNVLLALLSNPNFDFGGLM